MVSLKPVVARLPGPILRLAGALLVTLALGLAPALAHASVPAQVQLGSETLSLCQEAPVVGYCGKIGVPLDRGVYPRPIINISFEWYPANDGKASAPLGTVVPVEGGPGYPSIGSVDEGYAPMYGPLLKRWNMLAIDNRGTGTSAVINCPGLQDFEGPTAGEAYEQAAAECANALNNRWRGPHGAPIRGADLFSTAAAAGDMARVIETLGVGPVDLYGDSYGSYFAQVFAARYPQMLRSLTLDSTYGGEGEETLPYTDHDELVRHLDNVCERWSACTENEHQQPWVTIGELAEMLRSNPISGTVPGTMGRPTDVTMDVVGLVDLLNDAAGDKVIYADVDAAARAALKGYSAPLLRLYEQRLVLDEDYFGESVKTYSVGLYTDVTCTDYPPLYKLSASLPQRRNEYERVIAEAPAGAFAPFTTEEWLAQDQNTNSYSACLDWPAPTINEPPFEHPGPELPANLPVLVLGGELDIWTPPAEVAAVMNFLGGDSRYIELANATHVVGEADTPCGDALVRTFVEAPGALDSIDASCAEEPPIHAVGAYAQNLAEEPPATRTGGKATPTELKLLAAAVQTAGDGIMRLQNIDGATDHGLNGGKVTEGEGGAEVTYKADQLIPGVAVSGVSLLRAAPQESDGSFVKATLTVSAEGVGGQIAADWTTAGGASDVAHVRGRFDGKRITATVAAP